MSHLTQASWHSLAQIGREEELQCLMKCVVIPVLWNMLRSSLRSFFRYSTCNSPFVAWVVMKTRLYAVEVFAPADDGVDPIVPDSVGTSSCSHSSTLTCVGGTSNVRNQINKIFATWFKNCVISCICESFWFHNLFVKLQINTVSGESQRLKEVVPDAFSVFSRIFRPPIDSAETSGLDVDIVTTLEEKEGGILRTKSNSNNAHVQSHHVHAWIDAWVCERRR